jgi:hypothetical protein
MSLIRILVTTEVTLTHTFYVDETPTDASGAVTVTIKRLDGTTVVSGSATQPGPAGVYAFVVPEQATVDTLTVDWSGSLAGAIVSVRDYVEVAGGFLFGLAEARAAHPGLANTTDYPSTRLAAKRLEVEQECERICRRAFVPRFNRATLSGNDTDRLPIPNTDGRGSEIRAVRAVSIDGTAWSAPDVAALGFTDFGIIKRPGGALWPAGTGNIVVEYEHGLDYPPSELSEAAILRLRSRIAMPMSGVPDRAVSFTVTEGGTFRLSMPGKQLTGVPDVDAVYERHTRQQRAVFA